MQFTAGAFVLSNKAFIMDPRLVLKGIFYCYSLDGKVMNHRSEIFGNLLFQEKILCCGSGNFLLHF